MSARPAAADPGTPERNPVNGRISHAVADLYLEHHGWLKGWLRRKIGCSHQAADLAHDTFVRVLAARREQLGETPRALLAHIARGLVIDHWRRQEIERAYLETIARMPQACVPSAEEHVMVIEALARIDAMLAGLPGRTREIFLLAQLDGLTLEQTAERTRTPVITVRRHVRKALLACMAAF